MNICLWKQKHRGRVRISSLLAVGTACCLHAACLPACLPAQLPCFPSPRRNDFRPVHQQTCRSSVEFHAKKTHPTASLSDSTALQRLGARKSSEPVCQPLGDGRISRHSPGSTGQDRLPPLLLSSKPKSEPKVGKLLLSPHSLDLSYTRCIAGSRIPIQRSAGSSLPGRHRGGAAEKC